MPAATYAVVGYALLIIVIGILGSRKTKSFTDFLLGGRSVGPWMTAFSYGTAYFSAVLFIGFAGKIGWGFGLSGIWIAIGNTLVGVLLVWWLLGHRIKQVTGEYGVHTMPELLEARYGSRGLKLFTSLAIFVFFIPYSAAVFMGLGYLFTSNFQVSYELMVLLMGVFTGVYLVLGGYRSMAMIDVVFGVVMTIGVFVLLWSCLHRGGGLGQIVEDLRAKDELLVAPVGPPGFWPLVSLVFLTSIAPLGMPQLVQKFYAIRDRRSVRIGMIASTVFATIVTVTAYFTGALTRLFITPATHPGVFRDGKPNFDALMPELLTTVIPPALSIVIFLLILSASMSTLAALVLISSSTITKDLYAGFVRKDASDRRLTILVRLASVFFILLSMALALLRPAVIVTILSVSWGAIGSVFLGPFLWAVLGKRLVNRTGAFGASVLGLVTCLALFAIGGRGWVPQAGSIGMIVSLAAAPTISLLTRKS